MIRATTPADGEQLRAIERAAGERFREAGLPDIADDEPPSTEVLAAYATAGRSWVAEDPEGRVIGYVIVAVVDGNAHIEQVSVDPRHQGRGVGRALVDQVRVWATDTGRPAVTLTTFRDISWNAPLYRHLGFSDLADDELGPELRAVRDAEAAHGLDPTTRVCMRMDL
ncbi:MAG TPA: GNAT family N-acetyltransferase [Acidimicrobiales bacterium]|nr:GNAT family N-acetyltransferase [Acidimicrobiales bacterium]